MTNLNRYQEKIAETKKMLLSGLRIPPLPGDQEALDLEHTAIASIMEDTMGFHASIFEIISRLDNTQKLSVKNSTFYKKDLQFYDSWFFTPHEKMNDFREYILSVEMSDLLTLYHMLKDADEILRNSFLTSSIDPIEVKRREEEKVASAKEFGTSLISEEEEDIGINDIPDDEELNHFEPTTPQKNQNYLNKINEKQQNSEEVEEAPKKEVSIKEEPNTSTSPSEVTVYDAVDNKDVEETVSASDDSLLDVLNMLEENKNVFEQRYMFRNQKEGKLYLKRSHMIISFNELSEKDYKGFDKLLKSFKPLKQKFKINTPGTHFARSIEMLFNTLHIDDVPVFSKKFFDGVVMKYVKFDNIGAIIDDGEKREVFDNSFIFKWLDPLDYQFILTNLLRRFNPLIDHKFFRFNVFDDKHSNVKLDIDGLPEIEINKEQGDHVLSFLTNDDNDWKTSDDAFIVLDEKHVSIKSDGYDANDDSHTHTIQREIEEGTYLSNIKNSIKRHYSSESSSIHEFNMLPLSSMKPSSKYYMLNSKPPLLNYAYLERLLDTLNDIFGDSKYTETYIKDNFRKIMLEKILSLFIEFSLLKITVVDGGPDIQHKDQSRSLSMGEAMKVVEQLSSDASDSMTCDKILKRALRLVTGAIVSNFELTYNMNSTIAHMQGVSEVNHSSREITDTISIQYDTRGKEMTTDEFNSLRDEFMVKIGNLCDSKNISRYNKDNLIQRTMLMILPYPNLIGRLNFMTPAFYMETSVSTWVGGSEESISAI